MSDEFHIPDESIVRMISSWPALLTDVGAETVADEIVPIKPTNEAQRWMAQCRTMLRTDQHIMDDWRVKSMLTKASVKGGNVGVTDWYYAFKDGSLIISASKAEWALPS